MRDPLSLEPPGIGEPGPEEIRAIKKRGIQWATAGLVLVLCLMLGLKPLGFGSATYAEWATAAAVTLVAQTVMWLIPHLGLSERLAFDPHYVRIPTLVAALLLGLYAYIAPEWRDLFLMAWFVALFFMSGLGGLVEVILLSVFMALVYLGAMSLKAGEGANLSLVTEGVRVGAFLLFTGFGASVLERLRRNRRKMDELREQLAHQAITDPLTGLPNRRYFSEYLEAELDRISRYGGVCSVAVMDVDDFKDYNDTLGHMAGDEVLRELAEVFREELRVSDVVARYGGEEFALIMINTDRPEAREIADRLRARIEEHAFDRESVFPSGELTVSVGIASAPEHAETPGKLVSLADDALYDAKRSGKNRVHEAAA